MRSIVLTAAIAAAVLPLLGRGAEASVAVEIDLTHQRMHVEGASGSYDWPISSARSGFSTPGGSYAPTHLEPMHYSRKYGMSPMPHAIFFHGGYAIHGTSATGSLGRPASHGCVRLSPGHAAALYAMVRREGARISIAGTPPASAPFATARRRNRTNSYDVADDGFYRPAARWRGYATPTYGYGDGYTPPLAYGLPAMFSFDGQ